MNMKWIGCILIIAACGGCGFALAGEYRRQELLLRQMIRGLELMECELSCRMSTLPNLFRVAAQSSEGVLGSVFSAMEQELQQQVSPDASCCMKVVLSRFPQLPKCCTHVLLMLGDSLGQFDLEGQLQQIRSVHSESIHLLQQHSENRENRIRSYQTLGFCAGAALALLLV